MTFRRPDGEFKVKESAVRGWTAKDNSANFFPHAVNPDLDGSRDHDTVFGVGLTGYLDLQSDIVGQLLAVGGQSPCLAVNQNTSWKAFAKAGFAAAHSMLA